MFFRVRFSAALVAVLFGMAVLPALTATALGASAAGASAAVASAAPAVPAAASTNADLDKVLKQMDAASAKFQSAKADFKWDQYTKVVDETDTQKGTIYFKRVAGATEVAAQILNEDGNGFAKVLVYKNGELELYQPKIDDLKEYAAGKNGDKYESFLALGFGGRGSDLLKNWDVTYQGMEAVNDGSQTVQTAKLDLVPKQKSVSDMFTHITMWVDPTRGISLVQKSFEPSGDVRTAYYTNIRYDDSAAVPESVFTIKRTPVK